ncbi:MAG TPA: ACP phosphodiesterase [Cyclobacteriaceae bacterium]|jgi:acyl carrier protein phosphodiesterase|nr:ACP phosphodiesterase [Cyclobacteriaceae bacterium]
MNFLAHLFLSGENHEIKVGNFIGDFVKGKNVEERFGKEIAKGISLHREIDWFTDRHPVVKQSKDRLRAKYHHYSGVIVDVFYDHFLAKNFDRYSKIILPDFADECYAIIQQHDSILPEDVKYMMPYMINGNWLTNYSKIEGIHRALNGMSRRTKFVSKMDEASEDLKNHYSDFENEFFSFFPDLEKFADEWISAN